MNVVMGITTMRHEHTDAVIELGRRMHRESAYAVLPFDAEKVRRLIEFCIAHPAARCAFVVESAKKPIGMLLGYIDEYFFCREKIAADLILYVHPEHRSSGAGSELVRAFQRWAFDHGAHEVCLAVSTAVEAERTGRLYRNLGFGSVGGIYKQALHRHTDDAAQPEEIRV